MPIEIPFMSAIFSMITQFIYAHMKIYRKLTQNITKGQKRGKKGRKQILKMVKIKNAPRNNIYEYNFLHVYTIYICAYDNLQEFDPKYNQRPKKGPKQVKKMVKIKNAHRNTIFS